MKYKLIIFDLDGTLADTAPDVHFSMNILRSDLGLPPILLEEAKKAIGPGPELFVKHITSNDGNVNIPKTVKHFRRIYSQHLLDKTKLFPGILELIEYLHNNNFILIVVTNKPGRYSKQILAGLDISKYFKEILGPEDVKHQKPAPDSILKALDLAGVKANDALMVGDSEYDVRAALAAKIDVCAVEYGYSDKEKLIQFNPNYFITNPKELLPLIINNKIE
jgi:phosphoglycolate phosphatase